jgi:predicted TIM-barrel fold metal-dependent hydrolase
MSEAPIVVDADGHVVEPLTLWDQYVDDEFRARAPRFVLDEYGHPCTLFDGKVGMRAAMLLTLGPSYDTSRFARSRAGGWDPVARLADMDAEGIDVAVLFPSVSFFFPEMEDVRAQAALCHAYNNWLGDYCAAAPARLIGVAMLPLADVDASVRELERTATKLGFRGAFVRPNPIAGRPIHHPSYDRLWECAAALQVAITVHEGLSDNLPTLGRDRFENAAIQHVLSHPFEQMAACAGLILTGTLERHPGLRVAFLESGAGWLPYWLHRMDAHFATWRELFPALRLKPSEYFRRQCVVSADPDEEAVASVVRLAGDECLVWASDYPHPDAHFPGAVAKTLQVLRDVPAPSRDRILAGNAARIYRLDLPPRPLRAA